MATLEPEIEVITSGKKLAWNSFLTLFGQLVPMVVGVFAIRFLVRTLDGERLGVLTLVWAIIGYFSLFDFGLGRALTQLIASRLHDSHDEELPDQINSSLVLMAVLGSLGGVLIWLLSPLLVQHFLHISTALQPEALHAFYLVAFSTPLVVLTTGARGILEAQQSFSILNWIRIALGVYMFISPVIVGYFTPDLAAIVSVLVIGRFVVLIAHLVACQHYSPHFQLAKFHRVKFLQPAIIPLLRTGGWMTVSNLVSPLMVYLDRFLIGAFVSVTAVAYYVNPYEVVTKIWIIPSAIGSVLFPAFAIYFGKDNVKVEELFEQGLKAIFLLSFPLSLVIVTFAFEGLQLWLGPEYAKHSTFVAQWTAIGVLINCLAQLAFMLLQAAGRSDWTAKLHLIELPVYLLALCLGIKFYGINGAVIAWVFRVVLDAVMLLVISSRVLPEIRQKIKNILKLFCMAVLVMVLCMSVTNFQYKILSMVSSFLLVNYFAWVTILSVKEKQLVGRYLGWDLLRNVK